MIIKDFFVFIWSKFFLNKHVSILMYHSVDNRSEFFAVNPEEFQWQMGYLKKEQYNVIPLSELVSLFKTNNKIPKKTVVITFDDGYADNFKQAFPVLKKYGFTATIFLTTGLIGNKQYVNKHGSEFEMLDWSQIIEMNNSGLITFEPHTVNHHKLTWLSLVGVEKEALNSKEEIEKKLGNNCQHFAYPKGYFNQEIIKIIKKYFSSALTTTTGFVSERDGLYTLPRQSIDSKVSKLRFRLKI